MIFKDNIYIKWFLIPSNKEQGLCRPLVFNQSATNPQSFPLNSSVCLRHDLLTRMESAGTREMKSRLVIKCPAPGKTKRINYLPTGQEKASNAQGMPEGGDVKVSI